MEIIEPNLVLRNFGLFTGGRKKKSDKGEEMEGNHIEDATEDKPKTTPKSKFSMRMLLSLLNVLYTLSI